MDWSKAFRRASFRGVPFWVETESGPTVGRRAVIHEIAGGEHIVTEDMGRKARRFSVRAYVAGNGAIGAGRALEFACEAVGASLLTLPMDPFQMVHCETCTRTRDRDRNGFIAYDLAFAEASSGRSAAASPIAQLRHLVATATAAAVAISR